MDSKHLYENLVLALPCPRTVLYVRPCTRGPLRAPGCCALGHVLGHARLEPVDPHRGFFVCPRISSVELSPREYLFYIFGPFIHHHIKVELVGISPISPQGAHNPHDAPQVAFPLRQQRPDCHQPVTIPCQRTGRTQPTSGFCCEHVGRGSVGKGRGACGRGTCGRGACTRVGRGACGRGACTSPACGACGPPAPPSSAEEHRRKDPPHTGNRENYAMEVQPMG